MVAKYKKKVKIELVKILYHQLKYAIWAEALAAITLVAAMWTTVNHNILLSWLAFILIFSGLCRQLLVFRYENYISRCNVLYSTTKKWLMYFNIGVIASGISWGFAGYKFIQAIDMLHQSFIVFLLIGVTAAANPLYSPNKKSYTIFLPLAFVPFTVYLLQSKGIMFLLGMLASIYMIIMLITSHYSYKMIINSLDLRYKNDDLLLGLSKAKATLEQGKKELEKLLSSLKGTLEATADGILVIDSKQRVQSYNKKFLKMWGIPEEMISKSDTDAPLIKFVSNQLVDPNEFFSGIKRIYSDKNRSISDELHFKDGRTFERDSHPLRIKSMVVGRVWSFRDITEKKLMETELLQKAHYDSLTGLPNRLLFFDRISQAIIASRSENKQIAVLFIDLDRFKLINDTLGHSIGDKLLIEVSRRLVKCVRNIDTVSREGGDEFIILLESLHNEIPILNIARKCLTAINLPFFINNNIINITASIGISSYSVDGENHKVEEWNSDRNLGKYKDNPAKIAEILIKNSDIAMYRAKEFGNNYQFFTEELNKRLQKRVEIENELRNSIINNELFLVYQPIFNLKQYSIIGFEALLRWKHPQKGILMPDDFIKVAEEVGLIHDIGMWVLLTACRQLKKWQSQGFSTLEMAVNLSAKQFNQKDIYKHINHVLSITEVEPRFLILEITESIIMDDANKKIKILKRLKKIGIKIAIDDFGTGYSSLAYLKKLPVDKLKIDKSFIYGVPLDIKDCAIVRAIIELSNQLEINVIAEGIETKDQLVFLTKHGCNLAQGFYFSHPMTTESCQKFLSRS